MNKIVPLALLSFVAGCPSDPGNPSPLWLVPKNGEQNVALSPDEPNPY